MQIAQNPDRNIFAGWQEGDPSIVRDINGNISRFFVRSASGEQLERLFGGGAVHEYGDYGIITEPMSERDFREKISGTNFSYMRVINND